MLSECDDVDVDVDVDVLWVKLRVSELELEDVELMEGSSLPGSNGKQ